MSWDLPLQINNLTKKAVTNPLQANIQANSYYIAEQDAPPFGTAAIICRGTGTFLIEDPSNNPLLLVSNTGLVLGGATPNEVTVRAPTVIPSTDNSTLIATTAFVQSALSGGTAGNVNITENITNSNFYPTFVNSLTGSNPVYVDSTLTYNPSNGTISTGDTLKISGDIASGTTAIGLNSGQTSQGTNAVAVGVNAGQTTQSQQAVAVGQLAGNSSQGIGATAIGASAGQTSQGLSAVAIGGGAGQNNQGSSATAIGREAGQHSQGANAVAVGFRAGETNQHTNTIVLNANNGTPLNTDGTSRFFVKPVRNDTTKQNQVQYNSTTGEVSYVAQVVSPITTSGLDLTGNVALLSGTSGGSSGQHLVIVVNGVPYKIKLENP